MLKLFDARLIIFAVSLVGLLLLLKMCSGSAEVEDEFRIRNSGSVDNKASKDIEADSPKDTIMALTAHLRNTQVKFAKIQQQQDKSSRQQSELKKYVSNIKEIQKQVTDSLENMSQQIQKLSVRMKSNKEKSSVGNVYGLNIRNDNLVSNSVNKPQYIVYTDISRRRVSDVEHSDGKQIKNRGVRKEGPLLGVSGIDKNSKYSKSVDTAASFKSAAYFTVPENTTLVNATLFTALLGRIPVNGVVDDPFPFTVLIGNDNLAAMGFKLPAIRGMIMRGKAKGDLTLSCVTGEIISATFIFADGTIKTLHGSEGSPLAVIEDRQGLPCVPGRLISNAKKFITVRSLFGGIEAATRAGAISETTNSISPDSGVATSSVTGNTKNFMLNNMGSQAANESVSWWKNRNKQSFDVVFVKPGTKISLLIRKEMRIDLDKDGRKMTHSDQIYQKSLRQSFLD